MSSPAPATRRQRRCRTGRTARRGAALARCCATASSLAKRSLIKTSRTPEALIDVTLQPIIFLLLFTYIFGGAIAHGSTHDYLQFLLPGLLGQTIAMGGVAHRREPQHRHREGRLRPVPVACRSPGRRRWSARCSPTSSATLILCVRHLGFGYVLGFRDPAPNPLAALAAMRLSVALRAVLLLDLGVRRDDGPDAGSVQGIMFLIVLPLSFGSNTFVPTTTMPGWLQAFVKVNPITPPGRQRCAA